MMHRRKVNLIHYDILSLFGLFSLPVVSLFIAPLVHEYGHTFVYDRLGCPNYTDIIIDPVVSASVHTSCTLGGNALASVYLSGIASTLLVGLIIMLIDWWLTKKNHLEPSIFLSYISLGFIYSTAEYFFKTEGDIVNALDAMSVPYTIPALRVTGALIMLAYLGYFFMNLLYTSGRMNRKKDIK